MRIISSKFFCMEILSKGEIQQLNKKPRQGSKPFPSKISCPTSKARHLLHMHPFTKLCASGALKKGKNQIPLTAKSTPRKPQISTVAQQSHIKESSCFQLLSHLGWNSMCCAGGQIDYHNSPSGLKNDEIGEWITGHQSPLKTGW